MDFDSNFETSLNYDWERTKKRIFEELGQHQGQGGRSEADLGQSTRSFRGNASLAQSQSVCLHLWKASFSGTLCNF